MEPLITSQNHKSDLLMKWLEIEYALLLLFQSCPTLCDPIDGSPPSSPVPGILQARTLGWVAISFSNACMHAKSLQLCPTLCDPIDGSPPGSPVPGILQARTLEWVAISFNALLSVINKRLNLTDDWGEHGPKVCYAQSSQSVIYFCWCSYEESQWVYILGNHLFRKSMFIACQIHVSFFTDLLSSEVFLGKKYGFIADTWSNLWFIEVIVLS